MTDKSITVPQTAEWHEELVETALSYVAKGFHVFPCKRRSKAPATQHGFYDATTDEKRIREWWTQNPEYNIAIRTGKETGLVVVDDDDGGDVFTWIAEAANTLTAKTSDGYHLYFRYPEGKTVKSGSLHANVDVKADGGYVLAPGSVHPDGTRYTWGDEREMAELPASLGGTKREERIGVLMSEVIAERVEWLWSGRMPLGKITILDGDPGLGKSVAATDIAARVSTGRELPSGNLGNLGNFGNVGGVVYMTAEDGLADTLRPRLDAAGADPSKILSLTTYEDNPITLPSHLNLLERAIEAVEAKLIIIDPFIAFLDPRLSANQDQQVRVAMTPLAQLAERTKVAVLLIRHLNKKEALKALYRGGGSIGVIGAARSGLVVDKHPDNDKVRVLALTKHNLTEEAPALTYTIQTAPNGSARVEWGEAVDMDADELVNPDTSESDRAKQWLESFLRDMPLPATTVKQSAEEAGISERTLNRVKSALGVVSYRDGIGGAWRWHLSACGCDTCKSKRV